MLSTHKRTIKRGDARMDTATKSDLRKKLPGWWKRAQLIDCDVHVKADAKYFRELCQEIYGLTVEILDAIDKATEREGEGR